MSRGLIEPTLKKFFLNYDSEKLSFSLLSGNLQLKEMFLNRAAVNEVFAKNKQPFQLKFGMVTNLHIKISLLGLYIEEVTVEDLILVVGPDASKGTNSHNRLFEQDLKEEVWMHLIGNYERLKTGQEMIKLDKAKWVPDSLRAEYDKREKESINAFSEKGPVQKPSSNAQTTAVETKQPNLMGPELFGIITGRLKFNINIRNIRLYYEDSDNLNRSYGKGSSHISFCVNISEVTLKTVK
jgi:hypothetical protein